MANPITQIILSAVDRTKAAFTSAREGLRGVKKDADETSRGIELSGSKLTGLLSRFGLGIGALFSVPKLGGVLDDFSNLQARLKLASRSTEEYNAANKDLVRIAEAAKVPIADTATLYTRIANSVKDLDVSQSDVAGTTEAVALALRLSGASAEESSSAMLQFSQAIASGVLRGEEFNAVNEAAPRIMQALAQSLGVPVGALREMAKEGKLTRDVLIDGLLNQLPKLREEAETLPTTFGSTFTKIKNELFLIAGEFDKVTNATKGLSEFFGGIASTGLEALAVAGANVVFVFNTIGKEISGVGARLAALASGDFEQFKFIGKAIKEDAAQARKELDAFEKRIIKGDKAVNETRQKNSNETRNVVINDHETEAKAFKKSVDEKISDAKRLQSALQNAFSDSVTAEKRYRDEAKKLREGAANLSADGSAKSQESIRADATFATMKLERLKANGTPEEIRDQASAVKDLASNLDDAQYKTWLLQRAMLAESEAADKSADAEAAQSKGLAEQLRANEARMAQAKSDAEEISKPVSVAVTASPETDASLDKLREIKSLVDALKNSPINLNIATSGHDAAADTLSRAALQYGRRQ